MMQKTLYYLLSCFFLYHLAACDTDGQEKIETLPPDATASDTLARPSDQGLPQDTVKAIDATPDTHTTPLDSRSHDTTDVLEDPFFDGFVYLKGFQVLTQKKNNCGPASVRMVINYLTGNLLDEDALALEMRQHDIIDTAWAGNDYGTSPIALKWALDKYLSSITLQSNYKKIDDWKVRLTSIVGSIDKGLPMITEVETLDRGSHWIVIIGYDLKGERLLFANSGGHISTVMKGAYKQGWYEIATFEEFQTANGYGVGPLDDPLDQFILDLAAAVGLSKNLIIELTPI
jgi:hypothetical protein